MSMIRRIWLGLLVSSAAVMAAVPPASAQLQQKPNIVVIMGDDIGMWNIGAYHRMLFMDYYAEASCTAGRANFITGQLPIRTGMTTVGQAGASIGLPAEAVTIATALKSMGYATGQFGKNHLGDKAGIRRRAGSAGCWASAADRPTKFYAPQKGPAPRRAGRLSLSG